MPKDILAPGFFYSHYFTKIVFIIPARGNSKSIKYKNMLKYRGESLVMRAAEQAISAKFRLRDKYNTDFAIVVTSEDSMILQHAALLPLMTLHRPEELSMDDVQVDEVVPFTLRTLMINGEIENPRKTLTVVLQPTSIFRTVENIVDAIEQWFQYMAENNVNLSLMSGHLDSRFFYLYDHPMEAANHDPSIRTGRQDWEPNIFIENGAIYIALASEILTHRTFRHDPIYPFLMNEGDSLELDEPEDLEGLDI